MHHRFNATLERVLKQTPHAWQDFLSLRECDGVALMAAEETEPRPIGVCVARIVGQDEKIAVLRAIVCDRDYLDNRLKHEVAAILLMATELLEKHGDLVAVGTWYRTDSDGEALARLQTADFDIDALVSSDFRGTEKYTFACLERAIWAKRNLDVPPWFGVRE